MPSWETAVGNEDHYIDLTAPPVRQSAPSRFNRIKRRLVHRAALLGFKLHWEEDTAVLLEWDDELEKYKIGPQIQGIGAVKAFLEFLMSRPAGQTGSKAAVEKEAA